MKLCLKICLPVVLLSVSGLAQTNPVTSIEDFGGMAGCWERSDKAKSLLISEQWMKPAGTSILGMGRTVKGGKTVDFEFMRIEQRADGIFYVAKPSANKEETSFKLKSSTPNEIVFENPEHDFPQRVIYKLQGMKMIGRIEGNNNGKPMGIDFPMNKVKCE
ncbi:MAG: hypothetical protein HOP17_12615 [Acidobacteria bacterium]|nr:hypothetical protein [Acidobacteriota bacterium]